MFMQSYFSFIKKNACVSLIHLKLFFDFHLRYKFCVFTSLCNLSDVNSV